MAVGRANQPIPVALVPLEALLRVGRDYGVEMVGSGPVVLPFDGCNQFVAGRPTSLVQFDPGVAREVPERARDELREASTAVARQDEFALGTADRARLALEEAAVVTRVDRARHHRDDESPKRNVEDFRPRSAGSVTTERSAFHTTVDPYARHGGRLYRRPVDGDRLGLEPVSPETVLDDVAVSADRVSPLARLALWRGSMTTSVSIADAGRIVETSDGYVLLYERHRTTRPILDDPLFVALVTMGVVYCGFRLFWTGVRRWEGLD